MNIYERIQTLSPDQIRQQLSGISKSEVEYALGKSQLSERDFLALVSPAAEPYLEEIAQKAHHSTRRHFGNAVFLFTPLYVSNYCENTCQYCSFARQFTIDRKHLSVSEIEEEARLISSTGMRHILILTGESRSKAPVSYLREAVSVLSEHFASIGIEVYPMLEDEYGTLIRAGVDSLTVYQEVYQEDVYAELHKGGPKEDYRFRLEAADRACRQGIHAVTVGTLLGLNDFRVEAFYVAVHVKHLLDTFPGTEVSVSLPRMRPLVSDFPVPSPVNDRHFVQLLTAFRIMFPSVGITVSTRETAGFRNNILPLGVTRMSAGVSTAVGGHTGCGSTTQFEIADTRSLSQIKEELLNRGFQPVLHDWNSKLLSHDVI